MFLSNQSRSSSGDPHAPSPITKTQRQSTPGVSLGTSAAAITESILKRRWSAIILRHVATGITSPLAIAKKEPSLAHSILNQRLRTLQRYGLVARFPNPNSSQPAEYNITHLGRRILHLLDEIARVDQEITQQALGASPDARTAPIQKTPHPLKP